MKLPPVELDLAISSLSIQYSTTKSLWQVVFKRVFNIDFSYFCNCCAFGLREFIMHDLRVFKFSSSA